MKFRGVEVFGVIEQAEGKASTETLIAPWNQYAVDAVYRFLPDEQAVRRRALQQGAGRRCAGITGDVGAERGRSAAAGSSLPNLLAKAEYVKQTYFGYPPTNIKNGGKFDGLMLEGVVAF